MRRPLVFLALLLSRASTFVLPRSPFLNVRDGKQLHSSPQETQLVLKDFTLRPAHVDDLGAVVALLVSAFFGDSIWFTNICIRELGRLRDNFPPHQRRELCENGGCDSDFPLQFLADTAGAAAADDRGFHVMLVAELDECSKTGQRPPVNDESLVLLRARRMAGFVDMDFRPPKVSHADDPPRPYLSDLAVCVTQRRKGIGKALVAACEALVEEEAGRLLNLELVSGSKSSSSSSSSSSSHSSAGGWGGEEHPPSFVLEFPLKLYLKADVDNAAAIGLYHSLGYTVERHYPHVDTAPNKANDGKTNGGRVLLAKTIAEDAADLARKRGRRGIRGHRLNNKNEEEEEQEEELQNLGEKPVAGTPAASVAGSTRRAVAALAGGGSEPRAPDGTEDPDPLKSSAVKRALSSYDL